MIDGIPTNGLDTTFDYLVFLFGPTRRRMDFSPTHDYADFAEMKADYLRRGTITVNTAHSERTIFATPHLNHCFRYWHDIAHIQVDAPFTETGERRAAEWQIARVMDLVGPTWEAKNRWAAIIDTEVNGQVDYYLKHGTFPEDQRAFAIEHLAAKGYDVATFPHTLDGLVIEY